MRTRLRHLRHGSRVFTWRAEIHHLRGSADCHRCVRVRVWGSGRTGQALQADLLSLTWPAPWGACTTDGAYPAAADVRTLIRCALRYGWEPDRRGGAFVLSELRHAGAFALPDFLLTDRLRTPHGADPSARVISAHDMRQRS